MENAHLRLGLLEYVRITEKISTRIRLRVDRYSPAARPRHRTRPCRHGLSSVRSSCIDGRPSSRRIVSVIWHESSGYSELTRRGYRVIPQVKTGAYRIDMVVEGAGDVRLAIECDGDEYHGPDKWAQDMNRQRILERAGWVFWRCFASTWTLRKDEVIYELCERLNMMGIEPLGALEHTSTMVEKRVWHVPVEDSVAINSGAEGLQASLL